MGQKQNTSKQQINEWALLPSELKDLMPKRTFKHKLKQFLFNHFYL